MRGKLILSMAVLGIGSVLGGGETFASNPKKDFPITNSGTLDHEEAFKSINVGITDMNKNEESYEVEEPSLYVEIVTSDGQVFLLNNKSQNDFKKLMELGKIKRINIIDRGKQ